jgi:hypothetical protein
VKGTPGGRFALMRQVFKGAPLALNAAYIAWGEGARWPRPGRRRPATKR